MIRRIGLMRGGIEGERVEEPVLWRDVLFSLRKNRGRIVVRSRSVLKYRNSQMHLIRIS